MLNCLHSLSHLASQQTYERNIDIPFEEEKNTRKLLNGWIIQLNKDCASSLYTKMILHDPKDKSKLPSMPPPQKPISNHSFSMRLHETFTLYLLSLPSLHTWRIAWSFFCTPTKFCRVNYQSTCPISLYLFISFPEDCVWASCDHLFVCST